MTPAEVAQNVIPISQQPRFEPRDDIPVSVSAPLRGEQGDKFILTVLSFENYTDLPIIELKKISLKN